MINNQMIFYNQMITNLPKISLSKMMIFDFFFLLEIKILYRDVGDIKNNENINK